jgi:hypothetical protein
MVTDVYHCSLVQDVRDDAVTSSQRMEERDRDALHQSQRNQSFLVAMHVIPRPTCANPPIPPAGEQTLYIDLRSFPISANHLLMLLLQKTLVLSGDVAADSSIPLAILAGIEPVQNPPQASCPPLQVLESIMERRIVSPIANGQHHNCF